MAAKKISELVVLPEIANSDLLLVSSGTSSRSTTHAGLFANVNAPVVFNDTITFSSTSTFIDVNASEATNINAISLTVSGLSDLNTANIVDLNVNGISFDSSITALEAADTALDSRIDSNVANTAALDSANTALGTRVTVNETDITALEAADTALDLRIDSNVANTAALEAADTALDSRIDSNVANTAALDGRLDVVEPKVNSLETANTALNSRVVTAEGEIAALETADTALDSRIDSNVANVVTLDSKIDSNVVTLEAADTALDSRIDSNVANTAALDSKIDSNVVTLEAADSALGTRIDSNVANTAALELSNTNLSGDFTDGTLGTFTFRGVTVSTGSDLDNITDLNVSGDLDVSGNTTLATTNTTDLNVSAAAAISTLHVSGASFVQNMDVNGEAILSESAPIRFRTLDTFINSPSNGQMNLTADIVTVTGDETVSGTLDVTGDTTLETAVITALSVNGVSFDSSSITALEDANTALSGDFANGTAGDFTFRGTTIATGGAGLDTDAGDIRYANLATFTSANAQTFTELSALDSANTTTFGELSALGDRTTILELANTNLDDRLDIVEPNVTSLEDANTSLFSNFGGGDAGFFTFRGQTILTGGTGGSGLDIALGDTRYANLATFTSANTNLVSDFANGTAGDFTFRGQTITTGSSGLGIAEGDARYANLAVFDSANTRVAALEAADTALDSRIDSNVANTAALDGRLDVVEPKVNSLETANTALNSRVVTAEGEIAALDSRIDSNVANTAGLDSADTALDSRIDSNVANTAALDGRLDIVEPAITALEAANTALDSRVVTVEADITALETADTALDSRVTVNEGDITALETANTNLSGDFVDGITGSFTFRGQTVNTGSDFSNITDLNVSGDLDVSGNTTLATTNTTDLNVSGAAAITALSVNGVSFDSSSITALESSNTNLVSDFANGTAGDFTFRGQTITTGGSGGGAGLDTTAGDARYANLAVFDSANTRVAALEAADTALDSRIDSNVANTTALEAADIVLGDRLDVVEPNVTNLISANTAIYSKVSDLAGNVIILEADPLLASNVTSLESSNTVLSDDFGGGDAGFFTFRGQTILTGGTGGSGLDIALGDSRYANLATFTSANTNLEQEFGDGITGAFTFRGQTVNTGGILVDSASGSDTFISVYGANNPNDIAPNDGGSNNQIRFFVGTAHDGSQEKLRIDESTFSIISAGADPTLTVNTYNGSTIDLYKKTKLQFRNEFSYINSPLNGALDIGAHASLRLLSNNSVSIVSNTSSTITAPIVSIAAGNDTNNERIHIDAGGVSVMDTANRPALSVDTAIDGSTTIYDDYKLQFRNSSTYITSPGFGRMEIAAPTVDINPGSGGLNVTGVVSIDGVLQIAPSDGDSAKRYDIAVVANTTGAVFLTAANTSGTNFYTQLTEGSIPA